jgi:phosphatidylinositol alpha-1,6-mannosyltransferase
VRDLQQIVFLATDFRPMTGGIAESLHQLAHHVARHVPVTVMTSVAQNGADSSRAYRLIELPPLPDRKLGRRAGDSLAPIRKFHTGAYFLRLARYARHAAGMVKATGHQPEVIIGSWDTPSHFWCEACRRANIPYALVVHGAELLLPLYGRLPEWRREDFTRADRVLANSQATADLAVLRLGLRTRPTVINVPSGSRPPDGEVNRRAAELRDRLQLPKGPVLLSLGRLVRRKGFDLVLRAVAELSAQFPDLAYVIAGEGSEREALAELARTLGVADRIRMVGQVDDLTKWALYQISDVFVMPNRLLDGTDWEGFGIVFVEAALSSRPSVAGRTGGTADAVADGKSGLLVDPEREGELTAALRRLLGDEALRHRLGETGQHIAQTRFSGDVVADRLWNALQ